MSKTREKVREIIIEGPMSGPPRTAIETDTFFFIRDEDNNIWDGKNWRGFGMAAKFFSFRSALAKARQLKRRIRKAESQ